LIPETLTISANLSLTLLDQTRHYFGGFYHVSLLVYCDMPLERSCFDTEAEFLLAIEKIGRSVRFERVLEKMAVPEADLESVRHQLVETFYQTASAYLSNPGFVPRFVRSEYQKCVHKSPRMRTPRA